MDLGSTKKTIVETMETLPTRFDPIGGHPMCGKEKASIKHADQDLFNKAPFPLVRLERTSANAQTLAKQVVEAIGAFPVWLDAEIHDNWTAKTSHMPYLISNSLAAVTPLEAAILIGPGFRSTSRLAGSKIEMMMDILISNRSNILQALRDYEGSLLEIIKHLEQEDYQSLQELLVQGETQYNKINSTSGSVTKTL
jgi:prephenate dehydrogenase